MGGIVRDEDAAVRLKKGLGARHGLAAHKENAVDVADERAGASKEGILGSLIGTVVGVFLGGIVGILIMPLVGAAIGEFWAKRDLLHAGRVGLATWIGMIIGTVVKVALAFTMTGTLFAVYFL